MLTSLEQYLLAVRFVSVGGLVHDLHHRSARCGLAGVTVDQLSVSAQGHRLDFVDDKQCPHCRGPWGRDLP